jgi:AcrR family transcriptional regulator
MNPMSIPYESTGRTNQKARTRGALVEATRHLLAGGVTPTVEQAAATASVSRTTAYRYFPNQRALLAAAYPEIEASSLLDEDAPPDPEARLEAVVARITDFVVAHEPELRTQLRLSLEQSMADQEQLVLRRGRALAWIEDALEPLRERMPRQERRRLALAIRATVGIEALVWLTDIAGLSRKHAVDLMRWSARTLLHSALADAAAATARGMAR